ncbi:MAG: hypothetical protein ACREKL_08015 [Chthoniobacterales bacterium]
MKALPASLALLFGSVFPAFADTQYVVTEIRVGEFAFTQPASINSSGQVVGSAHNLFALDAYRWPFFPATSFLYQNGTTVILSGLGGTAVTASAINDAGQFVGSASSRDNSTVHAFLNSSGTVTDLGTLGGTTSDAKAINSSGVIAGNSDLHGDRRTHAFVYSAGTMTDLGTLGGAYSSASGINASGAIVGSSNLRGDKRAHAFLYSGGAMTDLGTLGGRDSAATAINAAGLIVGSSSLRGDKITHAFFYSNGVMTGLGPAGSSYSQADAIDTAGRIVGTFNTPHGSHAFLYASGSLADLNSLISRSSGWKLGEATAINDFGLIVGTGTINRRSRAFLLTPIDGTTPPPQIGFVRKTKITTSATHFWLHGATLGSTLYVTFRVGTKGPWLPAIGAGPWRLNARLNPGKNIITVIAHGPGGDSAPRRVVVTRR